MWSMQTLPSIETKFLCVNTEMQLGAFLDGGEVVWCQPDHKRILWHIMVLRRRIEFRGCCDKKADVRDKGPV